MSIHLNPSIEVFNSTENAAIHITVGEFPEMLEVKSKDDYYGKLDFSMDLEMAEAFAEALKRHCQLQREFIGKGV